MNEEKRMSDWTTDYRQLKSGDVFELEGLTIQPVVQNVQYDPGGGAGMGQYPPTWDIKTDLGRFVYDPWADHTYRRHRVVKSGVASSDLPFLDAVLNDKALQERRERAEQDAQRERDEAAVTSRSVAGDDGRAAGSVRILMKRMEVPMRKRPLPLEVVAVESDDVICWLQITAGVRIKHTIQYSFFHVDVGPGDEFDWYSDADIQPRRFDTTGLDKEIADLETM